jgi:hypothetical protein
MADRKRNPRNSNTELFRKLTRLLSGPLTNYRKQTPRQLRRIQLDKYKFHSAGGLSFKKTEYNPFSGMQSNYLRNQNRGDRYVDFDQMEYTPEIASTLDIYADEMTTSSNLNPLLTIDCSNEEIKSILQTLYENILNAEFNLFGWCRTMCKYGDYFLYLDIDEHEGITNVIGLPPAEIERLEGEDKANPNYVQFQWNSGGLTFENWQIAQFRILGNDKYAPYGTSILEPARRIWRQLILLEDAMMAYRIVRSPERRVFYIDVGNISAEDVDQYMQKVVTQMKRNQVIDPATGRVDLRYNPMSIDEDYFIPVRGGSSSKIDTLPGGTYTGDIDDVKYLRDKLFSALKVPQSYLSRGEGAEEDKTTLAQKDVRFARTIQRLQRAVTSELEKIGVIHLYTLGYREHDLVSFKLHLSNPSKIAELQELDHWKAKFDAAASATEGFFSKRWISKKLFNLSDEEIVRNQREMFFDAKFTSQLEAIAQEAMMPSGPGGGLGALPEGGEEPPMPLPEEDLGAEETQAPPPPGDESVLLSGDPGEGGPEIPPPGKRDAGWHKLTATDVRGKKTATTTKGSKGRWYTPGPHDKRTSSGPRKRSVSSLTGLEPLSHGIYEDIHPIYDDEEENLFRINHEVRVLLEGLENKNKTERVKDAKTET